MRGMTNLDYIRTLSAEELADLLYDYWLPRGQYVWSDSRKGLVKVLGEKYFEVVLESEIKKIN